jgi:hypothetical protein
MILDPPAPGGEGWNEIQSDFNMWHVRFTQVPGPTEKLVIGRQADYFGYFFHFGKFTPSDVNHFVNAYGNEAQLHAVFEIPANAQFNATQRVQNDVPLYVAAGDGCPFATLIPKIAKGPCKWVHSGRDRVD